MKKLHVRALANKYQVCDVTYCKVWLENKCVMQNKSGKSYVYLFGIRHVHLFGIIKFMHLTVLL